MDLLEEDIQFPLYFLKSMDELLDESLTLSDTARRFNLIENRLNVIWTVPNQYA
jgi:hypothetical protein